MTIGAFYFQPISKTPWILAAASKLNRFKSADFRVRNSTPTKRFKFSLECRLQREHRELFVSITILDTFNSSPFSTVRWKSHLTRKRPEQWPSSRPNWRGKQYKNWITLECEREQWAPLFLLTVRNNKPILPGAEWKFQVFIRAQCERTRGERYSLAIDDCVGVSALRCACESQRMQIYGTHCDIYTQLEVTAEHILAHGCECMCIGNCVSALVHMRFRAVSVVRAK